MTLKNTVLAIQANFGSPSRFATLQPSPQLHKVGTLMSAALAKLRCAKGFCAQPVCHLHTVKLCRTFIAVTIHPTFSCPSLPLKLPSHLFPTLLSIFKSLPWPLCCLSSRSHISLGCTARHCAAVHNCGKMVCGHILTYEAQHNHRSGCQHGTVAFSSVVLCRNGPSFPLLLP